MKNLKEIELKKPDILINNWKKTTIKHIKESELNIYLSRIKKINPEVIIYESKYSKEKETLTILANKKVNINRKISKVITILKNEKDINTEINNIINQEAITDEEYINLENVRKIFNQVYNNLYNKIEALKDKIENTIIYYYGINSSIAIYECENNIIKLGFSSNYKERKYKKIILDLRDNGWYIKKTDYDKSNYLIKLIIDELYKFQKVNKELSYFENQYTYNNRATNSNFKVDIDFYNISIYVINNINNSKVFEIKYSTYEDKAYIYNNDFNISITEPKKLLKNIYIPIIQCPKWCQEELYKIRDKETNNKKGKKYKIKRYSKK